MCWRSQKFGQSQQTVPLLAFVPTGVSGIGSRGSTYDRSAAPSGHEVADLADVADVSPGVQIPRARVRAHMRIDSNKVCNVCDEFRILFSLLGLRPADVGKSLGLQGSAKGSNVCNFLDDAHAVEGLPAIVRPAKHRDAILAKIETLIDIPSREHAQLRRLRARRAFPQLGAQ